MGMKRTCDRCSVEIGDAEVRQSLLASTSARPGGEPAPRSLWDLCTDCWLAFAKWFDS